MAGKITALLLLTFCLVPPASSAQSPTPDSPQSRTSQLLDRARQMILVTADGWDSVDGRLQRFERSASGRRWRKVGRPIPIVVGRSGLGWADDFIRELAAPGEPLKREGDGRSPAGLFTLGTAFGYARSLPLRLPWLSATPDTLCVDDPRSQHYNRLVDRSRISQPDWTSAEQMRRDDDLYRLGLVVNHNYPATTPGAGSCIFIHVWDGPHNGTAGCTAMTPDHLLAILRWLDPATHPVFVQIPRHLTTRVLNRPL